MREDNDKAATLLHDLYAAGAGLLDHQPWAFEHARWLDLLLCVLVAGVGMDADRARVMLSTMDRHGLLTPADADGPLDPVEAPFTRAQLTAYVASGHEDDPTVADEAVRLIANLGARVQQRWGGHVQRLLREHGRRMADDVAGDLIASGLPEDVALKAATLWLQRVCNIPSILPGDVHIEQFCARFDVTPDQLVDAADRLSLNVSLLDDLLAIEAIAHLDATQDEPADG